MAHHTERSFDFLHVNERAGKPRKVGVTEIRGPYYAPVGKNYLDDVLGTMGQYVDIFKFSKNLFWRTFRDVNDDVQPPAVAHPHHQFHSAEFTRYIQDFIQQREQ